MKLPRRNFLHLAAGAAALPCVSRIARAQDRRSRPVRIIVGFTAGSATDITARLFAQKLNEAWKTPVTVENIPGAGGSVGAESAPRTCHGVGGRLRMRRTDCEGGSPRVRHTTARIPFAWRRRGCVAARGARAAA